MGELGKAITAAGKLKRKEAKAKSDRAKRRAAKNPLTKQAGINAAIGKAKRTGAKRKAPLVPGRLNPKHLP